MAGFRQDELLRNVSAAIIAGDASARDAAQACLDAGIALDEIISKGVFSAWDEFCLWYARDPMGSLKRWLDCFNSTYRILRLLESGLPPPRAGAPAILVCTARGENHVLMKDIVALLLKARGFKVYCYRRGLAAGDASEATGDASLKYVVLSCIQEDAVQPASELVEGITARRPDVKVLAGGPMADRVHADAVVDGVESLFAIINPG